MRYLPGLICKKYIFHVVSWFRESVNFPADIVLRDRKIAIQDCH